MTTPKFKVGDTVYFYGTFKDDGTEVCAHVTCLDNFIKAGPDAEVYVYTADGDVFATRMGYVTWTSVETAAK